MKDLTRRLQVLEENHRQQEDAAWGPVMRQLTDDELDFIIGSVEKANNDKALLEDPAWVAANLTEGEQAAIQQFINLAEKAGLTWAA